MANDIVYLNGHFVEKQFATISPLDRGFLFGDGIYEVIPCHAKKLIGFDLHMTRLQSGLASIGISLDWSARQWRTMIASLLERNQAIDTSVYLHVSRGAEATRQHRFPQEVQPTVFAMCQAMPASSAANATDNRELSVVTQLDKRWRQCHVKATSLLGNVLHYQHGQNLHADETLLYNSQQELTEASTSNVFVVKDQCVFTPPLDHQLLPGVTRAMIIDILSKYAHIDVVQRPILLSEARLADEIWLTSSSKQVSAVVMLDEQTVGYGRRGKVCEMAQVLFDRYKFNY